MTVSNIASSTRCLSRCSKTPFKSLYSCRYTRPAPYIHIHLYLSAAVSLTFLLSCYTRFPKYSLKLDQCVYRVSRYVILRAFLQISISSAHLYNIFIHYFTNPKSCRSTTEIAVCVCVCVLPTYSKGGESAKEGNV